MTAADICNIALLFLGAEPITALVSSLPDATSDRQRLCSALYPETKRETLQAHPWNEAVVRTVLYAYTEPEADITLSAVDGGLVDVEASASVSFVGKVGYRIWEADGPGRATIFSVEDADTCIVEVTSAFSGTTFADGAWRLYTPEPAFEWGFQLALPSGYLRIHRTLDDVEVRREGQFLLAQVDELRCSYISDISESLFGPALLWAVAHNLTAKLAEPLTGQAAKTELFEKRYAARTQEARTADGQEGSPEQFRSDQIVDARR